ncbi:MAG: N-acetylmuramoyl-L-alanine amidase [Alphaproteobacteria bacterium]|nr:N-acetylmuramoyl-L-alanine amidase [Alphaproteobacteria bacterium]
MKRMPSPNFNARSSGVALQYVVLHYTGMRNAGAALSRLRDPASQASAHYMIDEDGSVTQMVEEDMRAWHAGKSFWRGVTDVNSASIGIELVNPGHEFGYRPFPDAQIAALKTLLRAIIDRHGLNPATALLGHSDIAPTRKEDPGELFPWQALAQEGLGLWPEPSVQDYDPPASEDEAADLLNAIGYEPNDSNAALFAFQRRYVPDNMSAETDAGTLAKLRALKRMLG